ncbi:hypothetical protein FZEAL_7105, partial [Fusarium zealandicum]
MNAPRRPPSICASRLLIVGKNIALRPEYPGAHVFRLYNTETDEPVEKSADIALSTTNWPTNRDQLASPVCSGAVTWKDNNPSDISSTEGYGRPSKAGEYDQLGRMELAEKEKVPTTSYFASDEGSGYHFTVFPHQDLFILRPQNMDNIDWDMLNFDIPVGSTGQGYTGLTNIALEYDPEWGFQAQEKAFSTEVNIVRKLIRIALD